MVFLVDSINTILQYVMIITIINFCVDEKYKKNKWQMMVYIVVLCLMTVMISSVMGASGLGAIVNHIFIMLFGAIIYKKDPLGATIGFSIIYFAICINLLICSNIYFPFIQPNLPAKYLNIGMILFIYLPQITMAVLVLNKKEFCYTIYKSIRSNVSSIITLIIITVVVDFIASFNSIIHGIDTLMQEIIFILLGIFIIVITIYFSQLEKKAKEIERLNLALEEKITALKKIKHDYGAQISYLYGLHLMDKHERLGELLKDIINGHNNVNQEIKILNKDCSTIAMIMAGIEHTDINVIIDEKADLEDTSLTELEIQRIISNIVRNSITAMNKAGILTIRTYYGINNIFIKIKNNGPKINDDIIDKIFDAGFTTKKYKYKECGFGLSIVKEIVESHNGSVSVHSTIEETEFNIKLPKVKNIKKVDF